MTHELLLRRERVMDDYYRVLDAVWPDRNGSEFVYQSHMALHELEDIISKMAQRGVGPVEQSRTYRFFGSVCSDLEPTFGKEMLLKAKEAFQMADIMLEGQDDELERAKLNFNFGNTLRLIDPNDIELLSESRFRLQQARDYFSEHAPEYLAQADTSLSSVGLLLQLAPLAKSVQKNLTDMAKLEEDLKQGGDTGILIEKMQGIMKRNGGIAGVTGQVKGIVDSLPPELKNDKRFSLVEQDLERVVNRIRNKEGTDHEKNEIIANLRSRLLADAHAGKVAGDRVVALQGLLDQLGALKSDDRSIPDIIRDIHAGRQMFGNHIEMLHYLSHGIEPPPSGSRAAELVELNWQLRRYLAEEMNRPEKGVNESRACLDLSVRATEFDKRIYEVGNDKLRARTLEIEGLRPLALEIRAFSGRMHSMMAKPVWPSEKVPVDVNAFFYSGDERLSPQITAACRPLGLEPMAYPRGRSFAEARWEQIQKAATTIFDFRVKEGPALAAVAYELGIALTLGKPVVVVIEKNQVMPFDVDVIPVECSSKENDHSELMAAVDVSLVRLYPRPRSKPHLYTVDHVLSCYPRPQADIYVDQTVKQLSGMNQDGDSLMISQTLAQLATFLKDGKTMLIQPFWPPVYPSAKAWRLFHVMPFRPEWANKVTEIVRNTCENTGVAYIRGDEVDNPDVIRSIWEEIARASHVLVDLTGFNANVALELGIADTLGKNTRMVGQGNTVDHLFPSIEKRRYYQYDLRDRKKSIRTQIEDFIAP
jgi:hypothetical protein